MAVLYPGATYAHTGGRRDVTLLQTEWNDVGDEVQAVEETVGANPHVSTARAKTYTNVKARLEDVEGVLNSALSVALQNLRIVNDGGTPNSKLTVTWDLLGIQQYISTTFTATLDATVVGANGRDQVYATENVTTKLVASTWYRLWAIYNPTAGIAATLISKESTGASPTMPAGYTLKRRIGYLRADAGANFLRMRQVDRETRYDMLDANIELRLYNATPAANTTVTLSCVTAVPPSSRRAFFMLAPGTTGQQLYVQPGDTFQAANTKGMFAATGFAGNLVPAHMLIDLDSSYQMKFLSTTANQVVVDCWGYYDPL